MEKLKKKINGHIDKFFIIALRPLTLLPKTTITQKKKKTPFIFFLLDCLLNRFKKVTPCQPT